jgi:hypothetical protein
MRKRIRTKGLSPFTGTFQLLSRPTRMHSGRTSFGTFSRVLEEQKGTSAHLGLKNNLLFRMLVKFLFFYLNYLFHLSLSACLRSPMYVYELVYDVLISGHLCPKIKMKPA